MSILELPDMEDLDEDGQSALMISMGGFIVGTEVTHLILVGVSKYGFAINILQNLKSGNIKDIIMAWMGLGGDIMDWLSGMTLKDEDFLFGGPAVLSVGVGLIIAGIAYWVVHHPEWISESIDSAQKIAEEAKDVALKMLQNMSKDSEAMAMMLPSLLPLLVGTGVAATGASVVLPGGVVPP